MTGAMLIPPYNAVRTQQTILHHAAKSFSDWFITYRNMHTGFNFIRSNFSRLKWQKPSMSMGTQFCVCRSAVINNQCPPNKQFEENQYLASLLNDRTESVDSLSSGGVQSINHPEYQRYPTSENHEIAHDC